MANNNKKELLAAKKWHTNVLVLNPDPSLSAALDVLHHQYAEGAGAFTCAGDAIIQHCGKGRGLGSRVQMCIDTIRLCMQTADLLVPANND